ncbi:hypothetical protein [Rheinheimera sp. MMS21-TC3]|uniref:hypothetical protein n=1 Tax=Rheinheimera sp. MMS21-TC3 TaxID=3072790 RepID=UPI0028C43D53|nr:hypothetical protein [Rheinheimera sp. MMS21-TC3]WNO61395.1 hypothetical protein RDV63_10655 [Rheinheimera sp. MMS21-TC3]
MADSQQLDIDEIVRDSFNIEDAIQLTDKLGQLEPEEVALALEAMPLEQRVSA